MNLFKKMSLIALISISTVLIFPADTFAQQDPCFINELGFCDDPNTDEPEETDPPVWVGTWIDQNFGFHSVSAPTFAECMLLLNEATTGQLVIQGRCRLVI